MAVSCQSIIDSNGGLDLGHFIDCMVNTIIAMFHDIFTAFAIGGPYLIIIFWLLLWIVLISGTILTIFYILNAALKPRW
jgi:hypothetical protein